MCVCRSRCDCLLPKVRAIVRWCVKRAIVFFVLVFLCVCLCVVVVLCLFYPHCTSVLIFCVRLPLFVFRVASVLFSSIPRCPVPWFLARFHRPSLSLCVASPHAASSCFSPGSFSVTLPFRFAFPSAAPPPPCASPSSQETRSVSRSSFTFPLPSLYYLFSRLSIPLRIRVKRVFHRLPSPSPPLLPFSSCISPQPTEGEVSNLVFLQA